MVVLCAWCKNTFSCMFEFLVDLKSGRQEWRNGQMWPLNQQPFYLVYFDNDEVSGDKDL